MGLYQKLVKAHARLADAEIDFAATESCGSPQQHEVCALRTELRSRIPEVVKKWDGPWKNARFLEDVVNAVIRRRGYETVRCVAPLGRVQVWPRVALAAALGVLCGCVWTTWIGNEDTGRAAAMICSSFCAGLALVVCVWFPVRV